MMPDAPGTPPRLPTSRLVLLVLVVLVGLGLFFALGRRTPAIASPTGVEVSP